MIWLTVTYVILRSPCRFFQGYCYFIFTQEGERQWIKHTHRAIPRGSGWAQCHTGVAVGCMDHQARESWTAHCLRKEAPTARTHRLTSLNSTQQIRSRISMHRLLRRSSLNDRWKINSTISWIYGTSHTALYPPLLPPYPNKTPQSRSWLIFFGPQLVGYRRCV